MRGLRAFLAFEVSPEVKESLLRVEEELREGRADVKLVERENLHFTVKFLGDVPEGVAEEVDERIGGLSLKGMEVKVKGLGAFPDPRRPRVVWAGVDPADLPTFSAAGKQVVDALDGIGERDERGFHPHITIARVRSPRNIESLASLIGASSSRDFGRTPIASLKLKSSDLTPRGPVYTDVREYRLQ